jgi:drug/metabolite transporter (DMT)-like permease
MDQRSPLDGRAAALMLLLCLIWSLQQISLKAVAEQASPMLLIGLRSGIAALLVTLLMWRRGELPTLASGRWRAGLWTGALFGLEYIVVAEALRLTHAAHVVVFLYTAPIFAALGLHGALRSERLQPLQWAGIGLAFGGIALTFLARAGGQVDLATQRILLGDALALLGGMAWGATTVVVRRTSLSAAPPTESLLYQLLGAFVLLWPLSLLTGRAHFEPSLTVWSHLAFQCLIVSFASFLAWCWLLRHYLASRLGVFSFLTPLFGVLLGHMLLGEPLETSFLAGGGLVLAGILMVSGHDLLKPRVGRPA